MELQNKNALITGVSKGLGKAITLLLLNKGVTVYGMGITKPAYTHPNLFFYECNIRDANAVEKVTKQVLSDANNKIDILINNSGLGYFGYLESYTNEQLLELFETNVFGLFYVTKAIIPAMKKSQYGNIINISSIAGLEGMPQVSLYCGTKFAVKGITDSLFKELREFNIKVTGVYPGSIQTDFFNNSEGIKAHDKMMQAQDVAQQIIYLLQSPDNLNINTLELRPLIVK